MKTKNSVCEDVSPVVREDGETPPRKKLKQARLPFQILSPGIESSSPLVKNSHKRKLSESADDVKVVKVVRPNDSSSQLGETKENVCSPSLSGDCTKPSDVILLSDSEDNVVTTSSNHEIVPAETQNNFSQNETTDKKPDVTHSPPTTDSEQSEIDDSPIVIESASPQNSLRDNNFKECDPNSVTPKQVSPHSSLDSAQKLRKLTPRQLQKQLESAKKKDEKERQRQEREKKKAEEKEEREKKKAEEKEEKLKQKLEKEEQKKKEKEEKEEQKKKEKEEKDRKKQVELEMKNEEKRAKDEEKRKKEDKRQAEVAAFTSFFVPKKTELKPVEEPKVKTEEKFMPFEVKADMRLAPITRRKLTLAFKQSLDQSIESQPEDQLYLDQIRSKKIIPQTSSSTWGLSDFKDDIIILDDDDEISSSAADNIVESYPAAGQLPRPKLLQFWENRRPPYWGTWRKESRCVGPKKPFNRDEKFFDYEIDSDDEWEEEEPGESLHGSDDEKESEDEYEVDNEFFVPHGYLSDEENVGQEDEDQSPEMFQTKLKLLEIEFEEEMKQKTERLKPRLFGCIWIDSKTTNCASSQLLKLLSPYQAVYRDGPIVTSAPDPASTTGSPESKNRIPSPTSQSLKRKKFPEAAIPALIKLIHGNVNRREFLIKEFLAYWNKEQQRSVGEGSVERNMSASPSPGDISKKSVSNKIRELATWIACPDDGPMSGRMCWYVPPETRAAHGLADITLPNTLWSYTFKPKRRESDIQMPSPSSAPSNECNPKQLITKFTKKMTEVERKKQFDTALTIGETIDNKPGDGSSQNGGKTQKKLVFNSSSKTSSSSNTGDQHKKKVPILMSDRMVQELPKTPKNSLMKFMKPQASASGEVQKIVPTSLNNEVAKTQDDVEDDCIILSD